LYLIAKKSDNSAYQQWQAYDQIKMQLKEKKEAFQSLLMTVTDENLVRAVLSDVMFHKLLPSTDLNPILNEVKKRRNDLSKTINVFIKAQAVEASDEFQKTFDEFQSGALSWSAEAIFIHSSLLLGQAQNLQEMIEMTNGNWDSPLTVDKLKEMVAAARKLGQDNIAIYRDQLRSGVKTAAKNPSDLLSLTRLVNRLHTAGISLKEENADLWTQWQELMKQRQDEITEMKSKGGVLRKQDLKDRFARPLAGGKGAHSGEILSAISTLKRAGILGDRFEVAVPTGFVVQPVEYERWVADGKPKQLRADLQNQIVSAYRDIVVRQANDIVTLLKKNRGDEISLTTLSTIEALMAPLKKATDAETVDGFVTMARIVFNRFLSRSTGIPLASEALIKRLEVFGSVAARSSGLREDSEMEAMAGMKETVLNVIGTKALSQAVLAVWSSGAEGVLVEEMINSKESFLAFSADPVTQKIGRVQVTAAYGLNKGLVDQTVEDPDVFVLARQGDLQNFGVVSEHIGKKAQQVYLSQTGGIGTETLAPASEAALTDQQFIQVAKTIEQLSKIFGFQDDVEGCFDSDNRLVILQVRPITTFRKALEQGADFILNPGEMNAAIEKDAAMVAAPSASAEKSNHAAVSATETETVAPGRKGGIDLNPANLNLQIKRDDAGVPLPLQFQDIPNIRINGLVPVIINIVPVADVPMLLGVIPPRKSSKELTLLDSRRDR
jgi:hypothetical protein